MPKRPHASRPSDQRNRDSRIWLFVALALTFAVRLWFILSMRGRPFSTMGPQYLDSFYYHQWAIEIISGNFWGSDVFFLRPLYPYLLAILYSIFGPHVLPVQLFQTLLSAASCFLLYDVSRRVFGKRPAVFASIGFALTGILVFYTGTLLYVEVTVFLSLLFLWLILIAGIRLWLWIAAGVSFGLLVICRPELLVLLPFLLLWLRRTRIANRQSPASGRTGLIALTAAALAVIAMVPIRNYIVARDPVLFTAHSGINFYYGNNPTADGTWQTTAELQRSPGFSHEELKRVARTIDGRQVPWSKASAYWLGKGLRFITTQPLAWLKLLGRKLLLFFGNYEVPNDYYPETARAMSVPLRLAFISFGLVLALGLIGVVWAWPKRGQALPVYLFVAAYLISSLLFYVLSRLRTPVIPFLLMFAGYGLSELVEAMKQRKSLRAALALAAGLVVYLGSSFTPVKKQSYSAQAWTQTGNIYLGQRQRVQAIEAFRRALQIQPSGYAARYSLIIALAGAGETDRAEAELPLLAQTGASSSEGRSLIRLASGRLAIARRAYTRADSIYQSALAENPNDVEANYMLGLVYISMDSLAQAREHLARASALEPGQQPIRDALNAVESRLSRQTQN
jgi:tetratricopeptide (TPR) repeat protein